MLLTAYTSDHLGTVTLVLGHYFLSIRIICSKCVYLYP